MPTSTHRDWKKINIAAIPGALVGLIPILSPALTAQQRLLLGVVVGLLSWAITLVAAVMNPHKT